MCNFVEQNRKLFDELDNLIDSLEVADESALIFVLKEAQGIFGYLPKEVQLHIADKLGVSPSKVYGVVSFYSYFSTNPIGEYKISVCLGTVCFVKGSDKVMAEFEKQLGIQLDKDLNPIAVAGCPPDSFSEDGQLWGNPLYDWEYHKYTNYKWWIKRIKYCYNLYDIVRIDHFRGFDEYFSIPYKSKTAVNGTWEKGPGIELFEQLKKELGNVDIIAEDLGFLTESVKKLLKDTDYPGMKILQFAFDAREESDYLPHNYNKNCVVYTGTHDNSTVRGWYKEIDDLDKKMCMDYINSDDSDEENISWDLICIAMRSVADTCVIPVQDFLGLDESARINTPSTLGDNWKWRMTLGCFSKELIDKIKRLTKIYGRI